jgi:DMSO/TMAO reductase YedYZ molybdopterin-dependent catalytic subunit
MLSTSDKAALLTSPEAQRIERRLLLRGGLSIGLLTALTGCDVTDGNAVQSALVAMSRWNDRVQAFLFSGDRLARTYSEAEVRRPWRYNAYYPAEETPVVDGVTYKLKLEGAIGKREPWTVQQVQALPAVSQITRHVCVEGWSAIGKWTGVPFGDFLKRVDADLTAKYVYFTCADGYTAGLDMRTCLHPQTLLSTHVNGEVLVPKYGYPLKLRVATKLGFKNPKLITSIWVGNEDRGGYWDDPRGRGVSTGYNWFSGL